MSSRSLGRRAAAVSILLVLLVAAGPADAAAWGVPGLSGGADVAASTGSEPAPRAVVAETVPGETLPSDPPAPPPASVAAPESAPAVVAEAPKATEARHRRTRPGFLVAVAMGASIDSSWSASTKTFVSPTFVGTLEFGDGPLGFGLRLLSSQASGRGADSGPDRLALDAMAAVRPWGTRRAAENLRWGSRVLRTVTLDVGLAVERISKDAASDMRGGPVFGGHADLPLTAAAGDGELRLRLGVRRMLAGTRPLGTGQAGDSTEAFAGLVAAF